MLWAKISPEYDHQRREERKAKRQYEQEKLNIQNSIKNNISGNMPNGDPAPKRKPGKIFGTVMVITYGAEFIQEHVNTINQSFNSDEISNEDMQTNYEQEPQPNFLDNILNTVQKTWDKIFNRE